MNIRTGKFAQTARQAFGSKAAATAATTFARSPSVSRSPKARSASWDRSPGCSRHSSRTVAQTQCPLRD
jgi:hypothetical protein